MNYHNLIILLLFLLLAFLFILLEIGRKVGVNHIASDPEGAKIGVSQVEGTIFALLGLLIAFTFYGASQRYDFRRQMIVQETNAIGTAWLRIDLLPTEVQPQMRMLFKQYANARLAVNTKLPDIKASEEQIRIANDLQYKIWDLAIMANAKAANPTLGVVLLPSLNNMFDIATEHNISLITHPPLIIFLTLVLLLCCSSFFLGYSMAGAKRPNWIHGLGYVFIMVLILFVIIDFEFPRVGVIKISKFDKPMIELVDHINAQTNK